MNKKRYVTYYDVLGISPQADDESIRYAYYRLARRWHPDRNPRNRQKAAQYFARINRAYTCLRTKPQRLAYNRMLQKIIAQQKPANENRSISQNAGFLPAVKEVLWPFVTEKEAHHG